MKRLAHLFVAALLACLTACDGENLYTNFRARFVMDHVMDVRELYFACNSSAEFCMIYPSGNYIVYKNAKTETPWPLTDYDRYAVFNMGLASTGYIVGRLTMSLDSNPMVCYDAVCPNCYRDNAINKRLRLKTKDLAECDPANNGCGRVYELDNNGYVSNPIEGKENRRLFRYRVTYGSNRLVISN